MTREVRAGIVVTGTEVLTGRIADRNGPWVSERLAELGVEVAHILVVGDRPADLEAALRFMAAEGMDLIVTSGGLGPTADDLTAEVVASFAGRELVLDEEMEEKIAAILRGFARRFNFDPEAVREANRKQAMMPEGSIALDPVGTAPGLVVPADGRVVIVLPGPPRELQPMWPAALATEPVQSPAGAPRRCTATRCGCSESPSPRSPRACARSRAEGVALPEVEITTCLRRGEIEIDVRYRDQASATAEAVQRGARRPSPAPPLQPRRGDDRLTGRGPAAGSPARTGGVLQRRPAGGADHRASRAPPPIIGGERRRLLQRGEGRAARRRPS